MKTKYLKEVERYLNHQMDEKERQGFEDRLQEDGPLRKAYEEYLEIQAALSDKEVLDLRKNLKELGKSYHKAEKKREGTRDRGMINNWFWLAALLIVSLSIISVTYLIVNSSPHSHFLGIKLGSGHQAEEIYHLEPAYAELVRYRVRSEDFHLGSPRDSLVVERGDNIIFNWKTPIQQPITLDIMNRYGKVIFSSNLAGKTQLEFAKRISEGIYVFRFRTASDTLYTGLFYVV